MQLHIARPAAYSLLATAGLQAHPGGTYWKRRQQNREAWDTSAAGSPTKIGTPQRPKQTASLHYPAAPARQAFPTATKGCVRRPCYKAGISASFDYISADEESLSVSAQGLLIPDMLLKHILHIFEMSGTFIPFWVYRTDSSFLPKLNKAT